MWPFKKSKTIASDFYEGCIIKMDVASRSHVFKPYYVECIYFNPNAKDGETIMETYIPGNHRLRMVVGSNWEYHKPRMTVIGNKIDFGHLLLNQDLKHK